MPGVQGSPEVWRAGLEHSKSMINKLWTLQLEHIWFTNPWMKKESFTPSWELTYSSYPISQGTVEFTCFPFLLARYVTFPWKACIYIYIYIRIPSRKRIRYPTRRGPSFIGLIPNSWNCCHLVATGCFWSFGTFITRSWSILPTKKWAKGGARSWKPTPPPYAKEFRSCLCGSQPEEDSQRVHVVRWWIHMLTYSFACI